VSRNVHELVIIDLTGGGASALARKLGIAPPVDLRKPPRHAFGRKAGALHRHAVNGSPRSCALAPRAPPRRERVARELVVHTSRAKRSMDFIARLEAIDRRYARSETGRGEQAQRPHTR
jgi:hypothetical protein